MDGWKSLICGLCLLQAFKPDAVGATARTKRFLLFPRQAPTRHQFIGGIGIPADLSYESLTMGYVLKAEFFLPYNETVYHENPLWPEYSIYQNSSARNARTARSQEPIRRSSLRWSLYETIASRLDSYGLNGRECLLQAICEANSIHFARHYNVIAELLHILLRPTASADLETPDSVHYTMAERMGRSGESCRIYACTFSILDWISNVLHDDV